MPVEDLPVTSTGVPFRIDPEPGETIIFTDEYQLYTDEFYAPFAFAISDRAVYLPASMVDPWSEKSSYYFRRVPLSEVREVVLVPLRHTGLVSLSITMVIAGAVAMIYIPEPFALYGVASIIIGGGLAFAARHRRGLRVTLTEGAFKWNPPLVLGVESKRRIANLLDGIVAGARKAGVHSRTTE